jgi:hypothetical protein
MSNRDRKKRILDHLAKSAGGLNYVEPLSNPSAESAATSPTPATETASEIVPTLSSAQTTSTLPSASAIANSIAERKRQVLDHVRQTSEPLVDLTLPDKSKQKRIQDHLKKSLN